MAVLSHVAFALG